MTHHLNQEQLINYIYHLLPNAEREALDLHLSACPSCRTNLDSHEALQQRIHYSVIARRRVAPSSRMNYTTLAPRLKRSRRITVVLKQSNQFIYGALTMALLVAVGLGVYLFVSNLSRPSPITSEDVTQPGTVPAVIYLPTTAPTAVIMQPTTTPTVPAATPEAVISQPTVNPTPEVSPPSASPVELILTIKNDPNLLSGPGYAAVDQQGNLYAIDVNNARIKKFDPDGQFLTMWGGRGTGDGQFRFIMREDQPWHGGIAVSGQNHVYVADTLNKRIQKFDSNGQFLAKWGSQGSGDGQFIHPTDAAVDGQGNVYVIDDQRNDIQKFDSSGQFLAKWGSQGSGDGQFKQARGLTADEEGYIYVADYGNHRVQKFDSQGQFLTQWGTDGIGEGQFLEIIELAVDKQGNVYVADTNSASIQKFDGTGKFLTRWGSFGAGDGQFDHPGGVAVDGAGNVYVADYGNNRVQKFRQLERMVATAQEGSPPVELIWILKGDPHPLSGPVSLAVDSQDNLYVINSGSNQIQKFAPDGQFLTMWGRHGTGDGEFSFVGAGTWYGGIAVDEQGQIYVADSMNRRIQKFDSNGQFLAKWDSRGMQDGQFVQPVDIAVDRQGYVYVTDNQRNDIQKFDGNGQFLAKWGSLGSDNGQFKQAWGLTANKEGFIYAADYGNHRIQKFDDQGQFLAKWGSLGKEDGQFVYLNDLAADEQGNVYIPDMTLNNIQKFNSNGQFLARWGSFGSGDGQFAQPTGAAVDGAGNVYVADYGNNRIQKFRQK